MVMMNNTMIPIEDNTVTHGQYNTRSTTYQVISNEMMMSHVELFTNHPCNTCNWHKHTTCSFLYAPPQIWQNTSISCFLSNIHNT